MKQVGSSVLCLDIKITITITKWHIGDDVKSSQTPFMTSNILKLQSFMVLEPFLSQPFSNIGLLVIVPRIEPCFINTIKTQYAELEPHWPLVTYKIRTVKGK